MYTSLTGQGEHNGTIRPIYTAFQTYLLSVRNVLTTLYVGVCRQVEERGGGFAWGISLFILAKLGGCNI